VAGVLAAPVVTLDIYYRDLEHMPLDQRAQANFDIPDSLDDALLAQHVTLLAQGQTVDAPVYDFKRHIRSAAVQRISPGAVIIVEGLFALYWEPLRALLNLKVYVEAGDATCLARRLERDIRERGRTRESVLEQYEATVRPMAEKYVLPTRRFAGLVLDGTKPIEESAGMVLACVTGSCPQRRVAS
jgi:uridine kinase